MAHIKKSDNVVRAEAFEQKQQLEPANGSYGIQETLEALGLICVLISNGVRWRWTNGATFVTMLHGVVERAVPAIEHYDRIPLELEDLSPGEIEMLAAYVETHIDWSPLNVAPSERKNDDVPPTYGVDETRDLVVFIARVSQFAVNNRTMSLPVIAAGVISLAPALWSALSGIGGVVAEFKDLVEDERKLLARIAADEFDLDDDAIEAFAELLWDWVTRFMIAGRKLYEVLRDGDINRAEVARDFSGDLVAVLALLAVVVRELKALKGLPDSTPEVGS